MLPSSPRGRGSCLTQRGKASLSSPLRCEHCILGELSSPVPVVAWTSLSSPCMAVVGVGTRGPVLPRHTGRVPGHGVPGAGLSLGPLSPEGEGRPRPIPWVDSSGWLGESPSPVGCLPHFPEES